MATKMLNTRTGTSCDIDALTYIDDVVTEMKIPITKIPTGEIDSKDEGFCGEL
jgi:hypothetical protein